MIKQADKNGVRAMSLTCAPCPCLFHLLFVQASDVLRPAICVMPGVVPTDAAVGPPISASSTPLWLMQDGKVDYAEFCELFRNSPSA